MSTKKPTHASRLQTMSVPELADGMVLVRLRLNRAGVKHRGRKLKDGPLLNGLVAWFLSRPVEEQDAIARHGLGVFEAILDGRGGDVAPSVPVAPRRDTSADPAGITDLSDLGRKRQAKRKDKVE